MRAAGTGARARSRGPGAGGRGLPALSSRSPPGAGVDFALKAAGGMLTPVALELNGGLCLEACGALEGLWAAPRLAPAADEAAAAPLVETMLRRSARCLMEGKQLLVVGAGGVSKKFVWEAARDYGLQVGGAEPQVLARAVEAGLWGGAWSKGALLGRDPRSRGGTWAGHPGPVQGSLGVGAGSAVLRG